MISPAELTSGVRSQLATTCRVQLLSWTPVVWNHSPRCGGQHGLRAVDTYVVDEPAVVHEVGATRRAGDAVALGIVAVRVLVGGDGRTAVVDKRHPLAADERVDEPQSQTSSMKCQFQKSSVVAVPLTATSRTLSDRLS